MGKKKGHSLSPFLTIEVLSHAYNSFLRIGKKNLKRKINTKYYFIMQTQFLADIIIDIFP